jgi:hypothetical protein
VSRSRDIVTCVTAERDNLKWIATTIFIQVKVTRLSLCAPWRPWRGCWNRALPFLVGRVVILMSQQFFFGTRAPRYHSIEVWVSPIVIPDICTTVKPLIPASIRTPDSPGHSLVIMPTTIFRLPYIYIYIYIDLCSIALWSLWSVALVSKTLSRNETVFNKGHTVVSQKFGMLQSQHRYSLSKFYLFTKMHGTNVKKTDIHYKHNVCMSHNV